MRSCQWWSISLPHASTSLIVSLNLLPPSLSDGPCYGPILTDDCCLGYGPHPVYCMSTHGAIASGMSLYSCFMWHGCTTNGWKLFCYDTLLPWKQISFMGISHLRCYLPSRRRLRKTSWWDGQESIDGKQAHTEAPGLSCCVQMTKPHPMCFPVPLWICSVLLLAPLTRHLILKAELN